MAFFVSVFAAMLLVISYGMGQPMDFSSVLPQQLSLSQKAATIPQQSSPQLSTFPKQLSLPKKADAKTIQSLAAKIAKIERLYNESLAAQKKDKTVEELSATVKNLQNQLQTLKGSQAGSPGADQETLEGLNQNIADMQTQLNSLQASAEKQEEKLKRFSELEGQINTLEETRASTSNTVNQMKHFVETSKVQNEKNTEGIRNEIQLAREDLNTLSAQMETVEGTMTQTSRQIDELRQDVGHLHENVNEIQKQHVAFPSQPNSYQDVGQPHEDVNGFQKKSASFPAQPNTYQGMQVPGSSNLANSGDSDTGGKCPEGFTYLKKVNNCYLHVEDKLEFDQAQDRCRSFGEGGTLAILDSDDKFAAVKQYLLNVGQTGDLLVGGKLNRNQYEWLTGGKIKNNNRNWCPGEPSAQRECLGLWWWSGNCLDDTHCSKMSFLCEIPPP